jgi:hypothetical protein
LWRSTNSAESSCTDDDGDGNGETLRVGETADDVEPPAAGVGGASDDRAAGATAAAEGDSCCCCNKRIIAPFGRSTTSVRLGDGVAHGGDLTSNIADSVLDIRHTFKGGLL